MECAGSHLPGYCKGPATLRCGSCGAVRYCSPQHQKRHWNEHSQLCARMAMQMQRAPELYDFPFTFALQTTRLHDSQETTTYCSLLQSWGLHSAGLWKASCDCYQISQVPTQQRTQELENPNWSLPARSCPCKPPKNAPQFQLQSWEDYYKWRDIPFDSPVALLLHWPLSLSHAICVSEFRIRNPNPNPNPKCLETRNPNSLRVHYLGPERELDQLPVFAELLALFPGVSIHIDFVGPGVPPFRDGESLEFSSFCRCSDNGCVCKKKESFLCKRGVTVQLWRGLYHDRYAELGDSPDLVFGANAGIAAFSSWHPSLRLIETLDVPVFFTDYCEEAAVMAMETIQSVCSGRRQQRALAFPVQVNPFRQPLCPGNMDLDLPTFSNAFIFGIRGAFMDS